MGAVQIHGSIPCGASTDDCRLAEADPAAERNRTRMTCGGLRAMLSNGTECWVGGVSLIALTIAMHSITLVYIALLLASLRNRIVRSNLSHRSTVWFAILIIAGTGAILAFLHATEMAVWAATYLSIGAMGSWTDAVLFSIDSMTTRGASGLDIAEQWRLMGALEATDGMLLFGISTAFLFAMLQQISPMLTDGNAPQPRPPLRPV
jgi:hypothetical protein